MIFLTFYLYVSSNGVLPVESFTVNSKNPNFYTYFESLQWIKHVATTQLSFLSVLFIHQSIDGIQRRIKLCSQGSQIRPPELSSEA